MPLTIKKLVEKFRYEFINIDGGVDNIRDTEEDGDVYITGNKIEQFLQKELTLMLDGIENEVKDKQLKVQADDYLLDECADYKLSDVKGSYNLGVQEVINIINSHKCL